MEALETGDFIRFQQHNRKKSLEVISVPLFIRKSKCRIYLPEPQIKAINWTKPKQTKKRGFWEWLVPDVGPSPRYLKDVTQPTKHESEDWDAENDDIEEEDAILFL